MADNEWDADRYIGNVGFVAELGRGVLEDLAPLPGERILDLGCGDGTLTLDLAARYSSVVAIDGSPSMVDAARARGLDAHVVDASRIPDAIAAGVLEAGSFDAVFTNATLHWIPQAAEVIAGVRALLKPGGRFVGEFGGHGNVAAVGIALDAAVQLHGGPAVGSPWFFPTPAEYARLLADGGFEVALMQHFARPTPLPTGAEGWIATFGHPFLVHLPESERPAAVATAAELIAPWLRDSSGTWTADYVRLRFAAVLG